MATSWESQGRPGSDEYLVTALQVFEVCGMRAGGSLPVNTLMDKFAPFVRTDKTEYSYLRSLLDPEKTNPAINAKELASALGQYTERQNFKIHFDDSFNLKNGSTPLDSDSGISTDVGFQLIEELQLELQEKCQLVTKLRLQLDASDRQHEEALIALTSERDSTRAALQLMREENHVLVCVRKECEDYSEQLFATESRLDERQKELEVARRRLRALQDTVDRTETELVTLQALLTKSKEECHKINDMYAHRQAALLEENEMLRSSCADLSIRFQDQEEYLQQILKEKVLLEMEIKDMLNKSNQPERARLDRSIDVSCTEAQLLRALDSLHSETEYRQENLSEDEFFISDCKVERGRPSLFDELKSLSIQTNLPDEYDECQTRKDSSSTASTGTRTAPCADSPDNNNNGAACDDCASSGRPEPPRTCAECNARGARVKELESKVRRSQSTIEDMQNELVHYENNLSVLQSNFECVEGKNKRFQSVVDALRRKLEALEPLAAERGARPVGSQAGRECTASVATQAGEPCAECEKRAHELSSAPKRRGGVRGYLWDVLRGARGALQVLAVLCFATALLLLYGVTHHGYAARRCGRGGGAGAGAVPWRWVGVRDLRDLLDLLFRIEYIGEIPM